MCRQTMGTCDQTKHSPCRWYRWSGEITCHQTIVTSSIPYKTNLSDYQRISVCKNICKDCILKIALQNKKHSILHPICSWSNVRTTNFISLTGCTCNTNRMISFRQNQEKIDTGLVCCDEIMCAISFGSMQLDNKMSIGYFYLLSQETRSSIFKNIIWKERVSMGKQMTLFFRRM